MGYLFDMEMFIHMHRTLLNIHIVLCGFCVCVCVIYIMYSPPATDAALKRQQEEDEGGGGRRSV